jgi:putative ABC transport system permease protein
MNLAVFAVIALLLLLIACVNYVNLTTARAVRRMKEIGIRKVLGAHRRMLMQQFLSESFAVSMVALFLALLLMELSFPAYRDIVGRELRMPSLFTLETLSALTGVYILVALLGGGYPALYLSTLRTTETLKGVLRSGKRLGKARSMLVVFQFAVSIGLLVCTGVVSRQLAFSKNMDPGFQKEGMIILPLVGENVKSRGTELQRALSSLPGVVSVAASSEVPSDGFTKNGYFPEQHETPMMIHVIDIDEHFLSTYGIQLVQGRNFSQEIQSDKSAYLVNETLAKRLGWEDPIGKKIVRNGTHTILGVVKDFHYATLHSDLEPLIITNQPWGDRFSFLSVRVMPGTVAERLAAIRSVWTDAAPGAPFDYWFLDDVFDQLYRSEQQFQKLFGAFSLLTIVIALLGLLSLAAFATEQRTKEIGIRKVLGASVMEICSLLTKEFVLLVVLANVFAWPVAYYAMSRWLEDFAYRVDIGWWVFALAGGSALAVALVTVSFQAVKAALANPVEALRYE